ncbi:hypothetical protein IJ847_01430 [Candidatus Saccharibacteria bacterium]|nr:hypothetical protein [Candidatus Saccharibacteria bacterium]
MSKLSGIFDKNFARASFDGSAKELAQFGSETLTAMLRFWKHARADLLKRRVRMLKKGGSSSRGYEIVRRELERADGYITVLKRLTKNAEWKPILPNLRDIDDYFGDLCYVRQDNYGACYRPAQITQIKGSVVRFELMDIPVHGEANYLSFDIMRADELNYYCLNPDHAQRIASACFLDYDERERWLGCIAASGHWFDARHE